MMRISAQVQHILSTCDMHETGWESKVELLLLQGVRYTFRAQQVAGGVDEVCRSADAPV